jgi:hypothetical protein
MANAPKPTTQQLLTALQKSFRSVSSFHVVMKVDNPGIATASLVQIRAANGDVGGQAAIDALFAQGNPDPALLGQKMIAMHAVRDQLQQARAALESTTTSVLTDEQKLKLDALNAARPPHGPWGGPPHPGQR